MVRFGETGGSSVTVPGLPKFDVRRLVHGSQTITVLKPLPLIGGDGWKLKRRICGVHENSESNDDLSPI